MDETPIQEVEETEAIPETITVKIEKEKPQEEPEDPEYHDGLAMENEDIEEFNNGPQ